jgi:hypothetical protein
MSFIRNGTLPFIAGNPPAAASQPSGMNGMIVTVPMKVAAGAERAENAELPVSCDWATFKPSACRNSTSC